MRCLGRFYWVVMTGMVLGASLGSVALQAAPTDDKKFEDSGHMITIYSIITFKQ